jgi:nucleotide-binding universal stress UspA family protein
MKTIFVPIDFSVESLIGLDMALMLAGKTRANINMIHVIVKSPDIANEITNKKTELVSYFEKLIGEYKLKSDNAINLSYTIKEGTVFNEITKLSSSCDEATIVLSTHGHSGFEELFIGGNAYKIVSHSKVPVITVRRSKIPEHIHKIVLPLDYSFETREKVPYTVYFAKLFNSEIHILTVQSSKHANIEKKLHQYSQQVAEFIKQHKVACVIEHVQGDNLTDLTIDYANRISADMISMMTKQEKSFSNLLLGSYAHQMINQSFIPVISFPTRHLTKYTENFRTQGISYGYNLF